MGKTSIPNQLKRNDSQRAFPKLNEPLSTEQAEELRELTGVYFPQKPVDNEKK
jgi:hypothetical protein